MFIVYGTKSHQKDGGVVGDWCDVCRAPNFHKLTHFFKVSHVYYIPMGKEEYVGTNRQCTQCGMTYACTMTAYMRPLAHQEAFGRTIDQVLEATNPLLMQKVHKQRSFEYEIAQRVMQPNPPSPGLPPLSPTSNQPDPRMLTALQTLRTLDARDQKVIQFLEKMHKWDYLTVSEREVLLHEINSFATEDYKVTSAIHFMRTLPTPDPGWIGNLGCLAGIVVLIVGFATLPFLYSWLWGPLIFVLTTALWFFASSKASEIAVRAWVTKTLIPKVRERNVDVRYFVGLLAEIKEEIKGEEIKRYEPKIITMARNVNVIADELVKQGYLTPETEAQAAVPPQMDILNLTSAPTEKPS